MKIKIGSVNPTYSNRTRPTQGERNWGRVYTPVWNVCMVTLWKYTWFWDHLGLLNHLRRRRSWEKMTFHVIFQPICTHNERCCWHMVIYEMSASMKVIWYLCVNIHGLEIIWTFILFEKPSLMRKITFQVLFLVKKFLGKFFFQQNFFCSECFNSQKIMFLKFPFFTKISTLRKFFSISIHLVKNFQSVEC